MEMIFWLEKRNALNHDFLQNRMLVLLSSVVQEKSHDEACLKRILANFVDREEEFKKWIMSCRESLSPSHWLSTLNWMRTDYHSIDVNMIELDKMFWERSSLKTELQILEINFKQSLEAIKFYLLEDENGKKPTIEELIDMITKLSMSIGKLPTSLQQISSTLK